MEMGETKSYTLLGISAEMAVLRLPQIGPLDWINQQKFYICSSETRQVHFSPRMKCEPFFIRIERGNDGIVAHRQ